MSEAHTDIDNPVGRSFPKTRTTIGSRFGSEGQTGFEGLPFFRRTSGSFSGALSPRFDFSRMLMLPDNPLDPQTSADHQALSIAPRGIVRLCVARRTGTSTCNKRLLSRTGRFGRRMKSNRITERVEASKACVYRVRDIAQQLYELPPPNSPPSFHRTD